MAGDSFDDDEEEVEGPRSSFGTYFAEGDALYKQGEYKKALESYSLVSPHQMPESGLNLTRNVMK